MIRFYRVIFLFGLFCALAVWPKTAEAAAPSPEVFGHLPAIYDADLSPDASEIALIKSQKGRYFIHIYEIANPDAKPRVYGFGEGVKPQYIKWVNNDRVLLSFWQSEVVFRTPLRMGYLFSLDTRTMDGDILVMPPKAKSTGSRLGAGSVFRQFNNVVVDWLEDDPDHILMSYSEKDNNIKPDLRIVDVATGSDKLVRSGQGGVQYWQTDLTGTARIGQGRKDDNNASWALQIKDSSGDKWRDSSEYPGLKADSDIHGFTANPDEMIISAYQGKDTIGLYVYDLGAKRITRKIYHNENYDATGVELSKDGGEVIGATYIADTPETEMIGTNDTILNAMRGKFEGYTVEYVDQSADGDTVLFKVSNPYDPGGLMMVSGASGAPQSIGTLRPSLKTESLGEVISLRYTARDGQKIPAYMTIPPTITDTSQLKNLPFVVLPHGGPYARSSKRFDYFAQFFASRGYGVLQMNFRGSEGYGKAFKEAGRENWVVMQEDVEDGTKWLLEKGYADPDKTCIAGWSYGGYAALMGAAKNPELYNCAIAMAALTDIRDFMTDQRKYRFGRQTAKSFIGNGFEDKDDIKANSPVKIAEDMTVPLFLAHGDRDQQVHFDQFKRMKKALKKSSAKVTYMEFEDEDHYLSDENNRKKFFKELDKFLRANNGKSKFEP